MTVFMQCIYIYIYHHPCLIVIILKTLKTMLALCFIDYHGMKTCARFEVCFHEF